MILVLGDCHAENPRNREKLETAYARTDEFPALQVGDLMHYTLPRDTWFIAGNNEDLDVIEALRRGRTPPKPVERAHLLASDVVEIEGLRVAGISGNYAPTQYRKPRANLMGGRRRHFTHGDIERAKGLEFVDVLLVHEAPHGLIENEEYDVGCSKIDDVIRTLSPSLCLVGHHHEHAESYLGETKVVSLLPVATGYYVLDPTDLTLQFHPVPDEQVRRTSGAPEEEKDDGSEEADAGDEGERDHHP